MRDILVSATIPFGLATSAAWSAFLAFELIKSGGLHPSFEAIAHNRFNSPGQRINAGW
jgi:hypothetical protein